MKFFVSIVLYCFIGGIFAAFGQYLISEKCGGPQYLNESSLTSVVIAWPGIVSMGLFTNNKTMALKNTCSPQYDKDKS